MQNLAFGHFCTFGHFFTPGGPAGTWGSLELRGSLEVVVWQVRSVCAKFGMDRGNGCGDMSRTKV